ncbi:hypothetical protein QAD02_007243 [Eretmocerus hayati]|uniref:Uncharacterized protein n=1 Tax=Eretmocerus hayati TaxID=131215 RepID=A0ACC2N3Y5_9HYME|nr:hypothetical protein QAD02_007243 [Eretmocerus hayati]
MERHTRDCAALNEQPIVLPDEDKNIEPQPCIIYADVECSIRPCNAYDSSSDSESEEEEKQEGFEDLECEEVKDYDERYGLEEFRRKKETNLERAAFQGHVPYALGYYYLHRCNGSKSHYKSHRGRYCEIERLALIKMTGEDQINFEAATICHFYEKEISDPDDNVADHQHRGEGLYRGAAHRVCNLQCRDPPVITVALHNLQNYDSHLLIRDICNVIPGRVTLIPETTEKYISFIKHMKGCDIRFNFIDVFKFPNTSLEKLASTLDDKDLHHWRKNIEEEQSLCNTDVEKHKDTADEMARNSGFIFLDLQGFKNDGQFIVKEALIADANAAHFDHWLFMPPYNIKNLSEKDGVQNIIMDYTGIKGSSRIRRQVGNLKMLYLMPAAPTWIDRYTYSLRGMRRRYGSNNWLRRSS